MEVKRMTQVSTWSVPKEKGYLYYVDSQGYISRTPMKRGAKAKGRKQRVSTQKIVREPGFLYFVNKKGFVCRAKQAHGKKKR